MSSGNRVNAVIFDLDGVLIDSEPIWDSVKLSLVREMGGTWRQSASADMMGMSPREWPIYMQNNLGLAEMTQEEIEARVIRGVRQRYTDQLPLIPGACEAVMRMASVWPVGLASSSSRSLIDLFLELSGLESSFAAVVASEEVERGKPAPDVYLEACRRLKIRPADAVAVEDSGSGILSAKVAGLHVIAVPNAAYLPNASILAQADCVLESIKDLREDTILSVLDSTTPGYVLRYPQTRHDTTSTGTLDLDSRRLPSKEETMADVIISQTPEQLASAAAEHLIQELSNAIRTRGAATWVLAGGTSPNAAYKILAKEYLNSIDWSRVSVIIGDERSAPPDNPESNWKVAEDLFLSKLDIPERQLLRPSFINSVEKAAEQYQAALEQLPRNEDGLPRLDVVWLGMGEDGHTLSLFPGHLSSQPTESLVIAVHDSPKPPPDRISLTFKALRGTVHGFILVAGSGKAEIVAQARRADSNLPIARAAREIEMAGGRVTWLLDKAASGEKV